MSFRSMMFRAWYWYVNKVDKNADILFMNYGYHDDNEHIELDPIDEPNRYSVQLYHRVAKMAELQGKDIVEVGCGRGGGLDYVTRRFKPSTALGVDLDATAAEFGNKHYKAPGLRFEQGNAQELTTIESASKDVVLNVESSHRYPEFHKFLSEVDRILKPGGHFLMTDFRYKDEMELFYKDIANSNFKCFDEQIINANVVKSLDHDTPRREALVKKLTPKMLHKTSLNFAGAVGSETYNQIRDGYYTYFVYCYQKPE
jgi:ubiquinone/menaquinone biosynthesis C-methylase UbiE